MNNATLTRKRHSETIEVSVDVDISDLVENGWHHEDDCPKEKASPVERDEEMRAAIVSLHQQAHGGESSDPVLCRREPCRSLTMAQLRGAR
jgi:hypothetical protein